MVILFIFERHILAFCNKVAFVQQMRTPLPRCLPPCAFPLNIGFNMLPSDFFMSYLDSLLGYSRREFHALQLVVFVAFGAVD